MNMIGAAFLNLAAPWYDSPASTGAIDLTYEDYMNVSEQVIEDYLEEAGLELADLLGLKRDSEAGAQERLLSELMDARDREADREGGCTRVARLDVVHAEGAAHYFTCKALSVPPGSILLYALILSRMVACHSRLRLEAA
ncbi:MAG: hypothetical protein HY319_08165 [Armatimonadetes bacterium]|nr:hypothetical protein [Armatimonadota bacterium]